jgi:hypothetical protein
MLMTREAETGAELTRCAATLGTVRTNFPHHEDIQALDTGTPRPQAPHPAAPDPGLPQPPGGWSKDQVMDDAQHIAYGHAWRDHAAQFPGMTQDQLADLVHRMLTGNPKTDPDLYVGQMSSGTTVIYKDGVLVLYDPNNTNDLGTVFKPDHGFQDFLRYVAPLISQPPNLPPMLDHPPVAPPQLQPDPAPLPLPPTQLVDPARLPPWLQNPSPPGFHVTPGQPPQIFDWDLPSDPVSASGPSPSSPGFTWPDLSGDAAKVGGFLAGIAGILGLFAHPGAQPTPAP